MRVTIIPEDKFIRKVDFVRALEFGNDTAPIAAQKQALRDVTNIVTEAEITGTTVDEITTELKAIWDEDLLGPNLQ